MGHHYLSSLFSPKSVAVFGASSNPQSVGALVLNNLLAYGFKGSVYPVNPKYPEIGGMKCYASPLDIPEGTDLAVIATPADTVPDIVEACGRRGVKSAVVISAGFSESGPSGRGLERSLVENAKRHGLRILGPKSLGILRPASHLNTTFNRGKPSAGKLAFVSQSAAISAAIMDWANINDVGLSTVVSMGNAVDLDFGDVLDYLVADAQTESILLYIEGVKNARSFMSGLRAAARIKPVIAVKAGRYAAASRAALSHTGALVGTDDIFDAALQRAGVLRVKTIGELFSAARALSFSCWPKGKRAVIVSNGGGPAVLATDRATELGLSLAELESETVERLNRALPSPWSNGNPVDLLADANPDRYRKALELCLADDNTDGAIVILTPHATSQPMETADVLADVGRQTQKPILAVWMGEIQVKEARRRLFEHRIPAFRTPEAAVEAYAFMTLHNQNQRMLMQTPAPLSSEQAPDLEGARMLIEGVLLERRKVLTEVESKALLSTFNIPFARSAVARSPADALLLSANLGYPVVMKVHSPDITHKSDAGGVRLNLANAQAVRSAYADIIAEVKKNRPDARIDGVTIESMIHKPNGREVMVGVTTDPLFGPVISFSGGGNMVEACGDPSVALPPLNRHLSRNLVQSARVSCLLGQYRHMPPVCMETLEDVLLRVSEMVCELPWIKELDINPLIVDENGAVALDARVVLDFEQPSAYRYDHMAVMPYPHHLVSEWRLADGRNLLLRPVRPEDAELVLAFFHGLSEQARHMRFQAGLGNLTPNMLVRLTQIDYDREMALIAVTSRDGAETCVGEVRYMIDPDGRSCEFALAVANDWQKMGLGARLMGGLMDAARLRGLECIEGEVFAKNTSMLRLMRKLGFSVDTEEDDPSMRRVSRML